MDEPTGPKPPTNLSIKLPPDVAAKLHERAYETGVSKRHLVIIAIRRMYNMPMPDSPDGP